MKGFGSADFGSSHKGQDVSRDFIALLFLKEVASIPDHNLRLVLGSGNQVAEELVSSSSNGITIRKHH